jgi:hypothetical protein
MSEADDNFLTRWTRRKHAVEAAEATGEASGAIVGNATQLPIEPDAEPSPAADAENEESENSELLPRIEDLTPQSDLSAFLRKGVPDALKKAALRRMWSLDPAIRDYIGPSEYAWDFNNPASHQGDGRRSVRHCAGQSGNSRRRTGRSRPAPSDADIGGRGGNARRPVAGCRGPGGCFRASSGSGRLDATIGSACRLPVRRGGGFAGERKPRRFWRRECEDPSARRFCPEKMKKRGQENMNV